MVKLSPRQIDLLKSARVGRLATRQIEELHLVPVCYVYDKKGIYIGTEAGSVKVKNLKRNPKATFLADRYLEDWSKLKGVMIRGRAELIERGEEFKSAQRLLYKKYPQYKSSYPLKEDEAVVIKIRPEAMVSWDYSE